MNPRYQHFYYVYTKALFLYAFHALIALDIFHGLIFLKLNTTNDTTIDWYRHR